MNQEMLKVLAGRQVYEGPPIMQVIEGAPIMRVVDGQMQTEITTPVSMHGLFHRENGSNGSSMVVDGSVGTGSPTTIDNGTVTVNGTGSLISTAASSAYLEGLLQEKRNLKETEGMDLTKHLLGQEIERLQTCGKSLLVRTEDRRLSDVTKDKAVKLSIRVIVPVRDHPKFNFVGKLLGPRGSSLKKLQEDTMTKMAILGRGSMKDKQKEEELRQTGDPKFIHLQDDLHVEVNAVAPPAEAHARLAYALTELRRYLVPDYNDDIRQQQMREIKLMNSKTNSNTTSNSNIAGNIPANSNGNDNGSTSGSEEGSCSPKSSGSPPPSGMPINRGLRGLRAGGSTLLPAPLTSLRGTEISMSRSLTGHHNSRRSVLTLLSRARAIQQKELEFIDGCHELPTPNYGGMYDQINEIPLADHTAKEVPGHLSMGLLKSSNPVDRSRFRHNPYGPQ